MHNKPWTTTQSDGSGPTAQTCGCGCGQTRNRQSGDETKPNSIWAWTLPAKVQVGMTATSQGA